MGFRLLPAALLGLMLGPAAPASAAQGAEGEARALINALGCKGCHRLDGEGGSMGAPLEEIGSRLSRDQLRLALTGEAGRGADSRMPSFHDLSEREIGLLVNFLAAPR